jgi:hypothetical protein
MQQEEIDRALNVAILPGSKIVCVLSSAAIEKQIEHWDENFCDTLRKTWTKGIPIVDTGVGVVLQDGLSYSVYELQETSHAPSNRNRNPLLKRLNIFGPAYLTPCLFERFQDSVHEWAEMCDRITPDALCGFLEHSRVFLGVDKSAIDGAVSILVS